MSTDPRFDVFPNQGTGEKQQRGFWGNCLIGCLVVFGVLVVIGILIAVWVARNASKWVADVSSVAVNQFISESDLPPEEKNQMREQAARVTNALRDRKIGISEYGIILQGVMESPLMPVLVVGAVDRQYLQRSGLTEDEKTQGRLSLKRFARGVVDKKIDEKGIDAVMQHVADQDGEGHWELHSIVSDEDLRAALTEAKAQADATGIEADPKDVDPSEELKKIVDEALGPAATTDTPPAPPEAPAKPAEIEDPAKPAEPAA
jgi:hypothetical protein